jgi:peptidoglycan hydrolase-like protein with peptidoglycan-binding domain
MATYAYDDFRVSFSLRDDGDYDLLGGCRTGTQVRAVFRLPLSPEELEQAVLGVARSRAAVRTRRASPVLESAMAASAPAAAPVVRDVGANRRSEIDGAKLGGLLADALFAGELGQAYEAALEEADRRIHGVRLTLSLADAPRLLSVPWEFLYRRPVFLASQRHTPVVRQLETGKRVPPPAIDTVVRVLAVIASPVDLPALQVDEERARVEQAVAAVALMGRVQLDWLDPATPRGLQQALRDGNYHVLHYVGHSDFTAEGDGLLYFEDAENHTSDVVDGTLLANLLSDQRMLRLVVLNSCEGARTTLDDPYAGVATTLVKLGVPAVVAMQFEISDDAAVLFAEELYANLIARQFPIDAAMAEARKAVFAEVGNGEWATPVLFVQDPDVALFDFRRQAEELPAPPPPRAEGARTLPPERATPLPSAGAPATVGRAGRVGRRWLVPAVIALVVVTVLATVLVVRTLWDGSEPIDYPTLELGADGVTVEAAQRLLRHHGAPDLRPSGVFDHDTEALLRDFERANDLPVDGILGPLTWSELVVNIRPGASGEAVIGSQLLLNANGAQPRLALDGVFGPRSQAATRAFEEVHGLPVDGIVDGEVWKRAAALAPPATFTSLPASPVTTTTTTAVAASTVDPDAPRTHSGFLAFVVEEQSGTHLRTVDPDAPGAEPGAATNRTGAVDDSPMWDPATNRLVFARRASPTDADVGVFYVVPGNGSDLGKQVARLITGRTGSERLPAWSPDGGLFYVATNRCSPAEPDCDDFIRLAHFDVSDERGEGAYVDDVRSLDTLRTRTDVLVAGPFDTVTALAADPVDASRLAVVDAEGLWIVDDGTATSLGPAAGTTALALTGDGQALVGAGADGGFTGVAMLRPDGSVLTSMTMTELIATSTDNTAIPPAAEIRSLSATGPDTLLGYLDDDDDALPGVLATIGVTGDTLTVRSVDPVPRAVASLGPVLAVAV